jgi:hypothetical protein
VRPTHPCLACHHRSAEECEVAAEATPERGRAVCPQCAHPCLSTSSVPRGHPGVFAAGRVPGRRENVGTGERDPPSQRERSATG